MVQRAVHGVMATVLGLVAGCGEPKVGPDEEPRIVDPTDGLVIAMQPVTQRVLRFEATSATRARVEAQGELTMAFADGYPRALSIVTDTWIDAFGLDCGYLVGEVELESVTGPADAPFSATLQGQRLVLGAQTAGSATIALEGTFVPDAHSCELPPGTGLPLGLSLRVNVVEPAGTEFELPGCDAVAPVAVPGRRVQDNEGFGWAFRPVLLDRDGSPFDAANASELAQATVVLSGEHDPGRDGRPDTLADWMAASAPEFVDLTPPWGEAIAVEVVEAAQVSDYHVSYQLPGDEGGGLRTTRAVQEGQHFDFGAEIGTQGLIAVVVETMEVEGREVCSAMPPAGWFELRSRTPDVCAVQEAGDEAFLPVFSGKALGQVAQVHGNGTCVLDLHGPADTMRTLSATFAGLDD